MLLLALPWVSESVVNVRWVRSHRPAWLGRGRATLGECTLGIALKRGMWPFWGIGCCSGGCMPGSGAVSAVPLPSSSRRGICVICYYSVTTRYIHCGLTHSLS